MTPEQPSKPPLLDYRRPPKRRRPTIVTFGETQWWALAIAAVAVAVGSVAKALPPSDHAFTVRLTSVAVVWFAALWYITARCGADQRLTPDVQYHLAFASSAVIVGYFTAFVLGDSSQPLAQQPPIVGWCIAAIAFFVGWFAVARWLGRRGARSAPRDGTDA